MQTKSFSDFPAASIIAAEKAVKEVLAENEGEYVRFQLDAVDTWTCERLNH